MKVGKWVIIVSVIIGGGTLRFVLQRKAHPHLPVLPERSMVQRAKLSRGSPEGPGISKLQKREQVAESEESPAEVLDLRKALVLFSRVSSKALLSQLEREEYHHLLSNQTYLRKSYLLLSDPSFQQDFGKVQSERILAANYLSKALQWSDNPSREQVVASIQSIIVLDNFSGGKTKEIKRSIAGDKIDLYISLLQYAPDAAAFIKTSNQDPHLAKLIRFAEGYYKGLYQRRRS